MKKTAFFCSLVALLCITMQSNSSYGEYYNRRRLRLAFVESITELPEQTVIVVKNKIDKSDLAKSTKEIFKECRKIDGKLVDPDYKTAIMLSIFLELDEKICTQKRSAVFSKYIMDRNPLFCSTDDYTGSSMHDVFTKGYKSIAYPLFSRKDIECFLRVIKKQESYRVDDPEIDSVACTVYGIVSKLSINRSLPIVRDQIIDRLKPVTKEKTRQLFLQLQRNNLSQDVIIKNIMPFYSTSMALFHYKL